MSFLFNSKRAKSQRAFSIQHAFSIHIISFQCIQFLILSFVLFIDITSSHCLSGCGYNTCILWDTNYGTNQLVATPPSVHTKALRPAQLLHMNRCFICVGSETAVVKVRNPKCSESSRLSRGMQADYAGVSHQQPVLSIQFLRVSAGAG